MAGDREHLIFDIECRTRQPHSECTWSSAHDIARKPGSIGEQSTVTHGDSGPNLRSLWHFESCGYDTDRWLAFMR